MCIQPCILTKYNKIWKCQSDIWPGHAQSQINLITRRKSSWDFIIYSRANPTFPIVKYRSFLFLFLLPIHCNVNEGRGTTVNDIVWRIFPLTCVYTMLLCTLWPYVRVAFPKLVDTDPPNVDFRSVSILENVWLAFHSVSKTKRDVANLEAQIRHQPLALQVTWCRP